MSVPVEDDLLSSTVLALEAMARKSTNGESAEYARLAGELEATRARYASQLRIQPATSQGSRPSLPPEEREK